MKLYRCDRCGAVSAFVGAPYELIGCDTLNCRGTLKELQLIFDGRLVLIQVKE